MSEQLTPTSGAAWRKPRTEGYTVALPSGNIATLRPVAIDEMLVQGEIPDLLSPVVAAALWDTEDVPPDVLAQNGELAGNFARLISIVVPAAMLCPRVVEDPQGDDEIALADLEFADKTVIFNLAAGGAAVLRAFCAQQSADVAALPDGENAGAEAE